jgi:predicted phosphodiesterase
VKIAVIPDTQVKPDIDLSYIRWVGKYMASKRPDVIVHLGDFTDMSSLSMYDKGHKSFEGRRYKKDVEVTHKAMNLFLEPIEKYNYVQKKYKKPIYSPRMVMCLGNHEDRISRAVEEDSKLDGTIGLEDLRYEEAGWSVFPYLKPVIIENIAFCHFFASGIMGRPITSARALLVRKHMSCVAGHLQGRDIAYGQRADGKDMTAIIAGSCYLHDEPYLNPQTNNHWRGLYMLHNVSCGAFDEMPVSLNYLKSKYGTDKEKN